MPFKFLVTALALLLSLSAPGTRAASLTLNPTATGVIGLANVMTINGPLIPFLSTSNPLDQLQDVAPDAFGMVRSDFSSQGYLIFDLSLLPFMPQSAVLEFSLQYARAATPNLTATSLALPVAQDLAAVPPGFEDFRVDGSSTPAEIAAYQRVLQAYNAISTGADLGVLSSAGPLDGLYNISLNSTALSLINAAGGLFAVGLQWTSTFDIVDDPFLGSYPVGNDVLVFNSAPRLVLSGVVAQIPVPGTAWLLLPVLFGLAARKRNIAHN